MNSRHLGFRASAGFTLIELMVVVAIVAILAVIAVPNYSAYVQRSRIVDATTRLSDFRVRMEQYFLDNRRYTKAGGGCGVADPTASGSDSFKVYCDPGKVDDTHYLIVAEGEATKSMGDFKYTIDQSNNKVTEKVPTGWTTSPNCWVTRKDGSC